MVTNALFDKYNTQEPLCFIMPKITLKPSFQGAVGVFSVHNLLEQLIPSEGEFDVGL